MISLRLFNVEDPRNVVPAVDIDRIRFTFNSSLRNQKWLSQHPTRGYIKKLTYELGINTAIP